MLELGHFGRLLGRDDQVGDDRHGRDGQTEERIVEGDGNALRQRGLTGRGVDALHTGERDDQTVNCAEQPEQRGQVGQLRERRGAFAEARQLGEVSAALRAEEARQIAVRFDRVQASGLAAEIKTRIGPISLPRIENRKSRIESYSPQLAILYLRTSIFNLQLRG